MSRWGDEKTIAFVKHYRKCVCLWDLNSPYYKNKQSRDSAYITFGKVLNDDNLTIQGTKNKIKNLRSTYHQELKKVHESSRNGDVYRPNLCWFDEMDAFLGDPLVVKSATSPTNLEYFEADTEEIPHREKSLTPSPQLRVVSPEPQACKRSSILIKRRLIRKRPLLKRAPIPVRNLVREVQQDTTLPSIPSDEFHFFGLSVAAQLRNLPMRSAMQMQAEIQTLLSQARLREHYDIGDEVYSSEVKEET